MEQQQALFGNYKYCEECRKPLPLTYKAALCPSCIEQKLFREVKEYIRTNDVTEYDVAEHFNIPRQRVKQWIREGRIEYKDNHLNTISMHCVKCGAPITFGTLCTKCLRLQGSTGYSAGPGKAEDSRMRYLDDSKK